MTEQTVTLTIDELEQLERGDIDPDDVLGDGGRALVSPAAAEALGLASIGGATGVAIAGLAGRGDAQTPAGQLGESGAELDSAYLSEIRGPIVEAASAIDTLHPVTIVKKGASTSRPDGSIVLEYTAIPSSAVHRWPVDEGSGQTWADAVGSADLSANFTNWVSGSQYQGGAAADLDGTDDHADTSSIISAMDGASFSFEIWINLDNHSGSGVITSQSDSGFTHAMSISIDRNDTSLVAFAAQNSSNNDQISGSKPSGLSQLVLVWDNSANSLTPYINNSQVSQSGDADRSVQQRFVVGEKGDGSEQVDATIDLIQVHDEVLSSSQVDTLYNAHPST
jgi:hypothetical protein